MSQKQSARATFLAAGLLSALIFSPYLAQAVAPATPTEVSITESTNTAFNDGQLTVTWKAVTNATGYAAKITRQGTTTPIVISTDGNSNTRALFTGLLGGQTYLVQVQALTGVEASSFTSSTSAVPKTLPKAPSKPTVVKGIGQATISWTALAGSETGGFDVTSYVVTELNSKKTKSVNGTTTSTVMTGLSNGAAVEFTVTAITAASSTGATSDKSDKYTLDDVPGAPEAPVVALTSTSGEVRTTWSAPTTDGGSAILSFTVKLFKDGVENTSKLIEKISDTFHTFTSLLAGKYTAKVVATNSVGDSALSALSNVVEIGAVASPTPTATSSATPTPTPTPSPTATPTPTPTPTESAPSGGGSVGGGGFFGGGGGALPPAVTPLVSPPAIATTSPSPSPSPSISPTLSPTPTPSQSNVLPKPNPSSSVIPNPTSTPGQISPTPKISPTVSPSEKPTALPTIKSNSYIAPVQVTSTTKQIPISSSKTTSTVVQPNKSLSLVIPAVKAGTKVALTLKGPDGKTITIPTPKVSKSGTYKLPALQFKKPGTYTMTVKVGSATKSIKVTVPKAK